MLPILNYITWDVSPFIYEGDHFAIGWYGTLWTLGLIGMLVTLLLTFKHDGVPTQYALITFMVTLVCVIYGGHLFQGLFYEWYYTPDDPAHFLGIDWFYRNWYFEHPWKFLDISHGGFASHGTAMGVVLAGWLLAKPLKCDMWYVADRAMMGLCVVAICVRMGNFVLGEISGVETTMPWGMKFYDGDYIHHPTQLYEALSFFLTLCVAIYLYFWHDAGKYKGLLSGVIMSIALLLRIMIEMVKLPNMQIEENWLLNMGQWLSIPMAIWAIWLVFYSLENGKCNDIQPHISISCADKRRIKRKK